MKTTTKTGVSTQDALHIQQAFSYAQTIDDCFVDMEETLRMASYAQSLERRCHLWVANKLTKSAEVSLFQALEKLNVIRELPSSFLERAVQLQEHLHETYESEEVEEWEG